MIFGSLGTLALGEVPTSVRPSPIFPAELIFPLDIDACFENDEMLSVFGGENPYGIPEWVADPFAEPVDVEYFILDTDLAPDELLSIHGVGTPEGIPEWIADPLADSTHPTLGPLETDQHPSRNLVYNPKTEF